MTRTQTGPGSRKPGTGRPPRSADWILKRVLPSGKRGESILGDLHEEFFRLPVPDARFPAVWYWQQTLRLALRYGARRSPQEALTYPRSNPMWFELSSDFRTAYRSIVRAPGVSLLIVLTLGSAIAASTIGFTFADLALFRGLPVDDTAKVVSIFASDIQGATPRARVSGPDFLDIKARATLLDHMSAFRDGRAPLISDGQSQTLSVSYATGDLFTTMGQPAFRGRAFTTADDRPGAPPVALLAHHYWQSAFQGRESVLGTTLQIGREHFTVVGVLTPDLEFGNIGEIEVWLPLQISPSAPRDIRNLRFMARLKDGVAFEQAAAEMASISAALAAEHPDANGGWRLRLAPVTELTGGSGFYVVIALFLLSMGLLMAIAIANVSNLALARTLSRVRELAVRSALGARKGRLVRQFIIEGLVLSVIAAVASLPLAWTGLRAIQTASAEAVFRGLQIDWHELSFIAVVALVCPLFFSIAPVRLLSRPDVRHVLAGSGGRGSTAASRGRGALVVLQVALAVILLTVSSLSLRSVRDIYTQPIGIDTAGLTVMGLEFNDVLYPSPAQAAAAAEETRARLAALPGVRNASMVNALPILGDRMPVPLVLDTAAGDANEVKPNAVVTSATSGAGEALGLRMLAGTWWRDGDRDVAVISQAAADRYFGGAARAIGRHFKVTESDRVIDARVVGVSSDIAHTDRTSAPPARVWLPLGDRARRVTYVLKADAGDALAGGIRKTIAVTAPAVPIEYLETMDESLQQAASSDFAIIGALTGFALLALLLASAGLFGVVSYGVAQRTAEFGTRMALGASSGDVVRLVARQSLAMLAIGVSIGMSIGVGIGFMMSSNLDRISPLDPVTLASVIALLAGVTIVATALPAWRASRIDPVIALRTE